VTDFIFGINNKFWRRVVKCPKPEIVKHKRNLEDGWQFTLAIEARKLLANNVTTVCITKRPEV